MSAPFQYYGKASHMSADLKRVLHANRARNPERFAPKTFTPTSMKDRGPVVTGETVTIEVMSPRRRHEFAHATPRSYG